MAGSAQICLALTDSVVKINKILTIIEISVDESASNQIQKGSTYEKMMSGIKVEYVPIKSIRFFPSTSSDVLLKIQKILNLNQYSFNFIKFFSISYFQLLEFKPNKQLFDEMKTIYYDAFQKLNFLAKILVKYEILKKTVMPYIDVLLIKTRFKKSNSWKIISLKNVEIDYYNSNKKKLEIYK